MEQININLENINFSSVISNIKNSGEYNNFVQKLNNKLNRSIELSVYKNSDDNFGFYSMLTLDELNYLGY